METKLYKKFLILPSFGFLLFFTNTVSAAGLYLIPPSSNVLVGGNFNVSLVLNTKDVPINIVESELFFPPDKLQLAAPSFGESIIQIWPTPPVFSNVDGRVYLVGGKPSPGITTRKGVVLTLAFKVVGSGTGEIKFGPKSSVLANDGAGTDLLIEKTSAFFSATFPPSLGPVISSPTNSDQRKWYSNNSPVFNWPNDPLAEDYSYRIDHDPNGSVGEVSRGTSTSASFTNLANGIWYFHLREKANGVWGGTSHYAVKIDNEPPEPFMVSVSPSDRTVSQSPIFRFSTSDALSGLDHFEMKIVPLSSGDTEAVSFFEASSPYQAVNWKVGRYLVVVRAIDKAGNTRDETVTASSDNPLSKLIGQEGVNLIFAVIPWIWVIFAAALILFIIFLIFLNLWIRHHLHLHAAFREDLRKLTGIFKKKI